MTFTEAVKTCFSKYANFSGRASRSEYWWFVLFIFAGTFILAILDRMLFPGMVGGARQSGVLTPLFQLAVLLPALAAGWRRMQDSGRAGWLILLPFLTSIVIMILVLSGVSGFGMIVAGLVQIGVTILTVWWLTRPSQP